MTWERWQWRGTLHSSKLQHYRNFIIRLFNVISRTFVMGGVTSMQRCCRCIRQPQATRLKKTGSKTVILHLRNVLLSHPAFSGWFWQMHIWKLSCMQIINIWSKYLKRCFQHMIILNKYESLIDTTIQRKRMFVCWLVGWFFLVRINPFQVIESPKEISTIQSRISTQFSSVWPIDRALSGTTTPNHSGPGSDVNEGVLCIPQSSSITEASPLDCLMSYRGHSFGEVLPLCRDSVDVFYSLANWSRKIITSPVNTWVDKT